MFQSKFFSAEKVFPHVTAVTGLAGEKCYLVEGRDSALLIDALTGVGSLKAFVRELTDLPVRLVTPTATWTTAGLCSSTGRAASIRRTWRCSMSTPTRKCA